jgi:CrcB protein
VVTDPAPGSLPVDADIDLHVPAQRRELDRAPYAVLSVIALGGAAGAVVRHGVGAAFPATPHGVPWATFAVNVSGCLLIGVLMVLVVRVWPDRPLVRPFLGVGVLGGYTTFSTYAVEVLRLVDARAAGTALAYLLGTVAAAVAATWAGMAAARGAVRSVARYAAGARR